MSNRTKHVCPVAAYGSLDNRIRRWIQNPRKLLAPYIDEGMSVLDLGCGPGFFSIEIALMVGRSGHVTAADLQGGMLKKLGNKIQGTELEERITLHKCDANTIGLSGSFHFVLLFYMVHEVPNAAGFFREIETILKPNGQVLVVEPPIHVSKKAFEETLRTADAAGLEVAGRPGFFPNKAAILEKYRSNT
jgi:ubiquinone/menaquinone biosynthesis C-methylase UbiE